VWLPILVLTWVGAIPLLLSVVGDRGPGAVDNASGVAAVLEAAELLDAVASALTRRGADVVRASSGADLIEQLANAGPFDLVVTDIGMPWMSGLQAMHLTRAAGLPEPPMIIDLPITAASAGARALNNKGPFDCLAILESIQRSLYHGTLNLSILAAPRIGFKMTRSVLRHSGLKVLTSSRLTTNRSKISSPISQAVPSVGVTTRST